MRIEWLKELRDRLVDLLDWAPNVTTGTDTTWNVASGHGQGAKDRPVRAPGLQAEREKEKAPQGKQKAGEATRLPAATRPGGPKLNGMPKAPKAKGKTWSGGNASSPETERMVQLMRGVAEPFGSGTVMAVTGTPQKKASNFITQGKVKGWLKAEGKGLYRRTATYGVPRQPRKAEKPMCEVNARNWSMREEISKEIQEKQKVES